MNKLILAASLAAITLPAVPVNADPPDWAPAHGRRDHDRDEWRDHDRRRDREERRERRDYRDYRDYRGYGYSHPYRAGTYAEVRLQRGDRVWRGNDGRYYCRRSDGTTGLIVGAAIGGMVGRSLDDGRDRTLGTVLGMIGGGLLGRSVDRGDLRCR